MIERDHIEKILKLNGLEPTAQDEEIKSILLSARYKEHEVDAAIMVLRENKFTNKTKVDGLHKVFRSDRLLNSEEISALLGIDVDLEERVSAGAKARRLTSLSQMTLIMFSFFLALAMMLLYMYVSKIGIFHPTSALALKFF